MKKKIEVVAALIKENNKYFCAQRADNGELAKKWEFPGGKIESGETHQESLKREIQEELDLNIKVNDHFITVVHEYKRFILTLHCYEADIINGDLVLNEHLDYKWLLPKEMKEYDFAAADIPIINKLIEI